MAIGGFDVSNNENENHLTNIDVFKGAAYLKSVELYDNDSNSWKLHGGMNYRRLGGGVGVLKVQPNDSILYETNSTLTSSGSISPDDIKNRALSKLVDL